MVNQIVFVDANKKFISEFVMALENQLSQGTSLVNPAADWRFVMQQRA